VFVNHRKLSCELAVVCEPLTEKHCMRQLNCIPAL